MVFKTQLFLYQHGPIDIRHTVVNICKVQGFTDRDVYSVGLLTIFGDDFSCVTDIQTSFLIQKMFLHSQLIELCFYYLILLIVSIAEMDIFLVLLAIVTILLVITLMSRERKNFPPGPPGIPLLGNINDLKPESMLTTLR